VARNLGIPGGLVPSAVRSSSPSWRDPRLWVGVSIIAASVLVGTRVLASADDTVQVWAVGADVEPGERLTEADLEAQRLRFADGGDLGRYYEVGADLPGDLTLVRGLGAGELLPRSAIGAVDGADTVTISLAVMGAPRGIGAGSVVDVYVSGDPADSEADPRDAGLAALEDVRVVAATSDDDSFTPTGERRVELAVPDTDVAAFYSLLGRLSTPVLSLAQVS
jgi:hypothetical protein